jgi:hypothetical protein
MFLEIQCEDSVCSCEVSGATPLCQTGDTKVALNVVMAAAVNFNK